MYCRFSRHSNRYYKEDKLAEPKSHFLARKGFPEKGGGVSKGLDVRGVNEGNVSELWKSVGNYERVWVISSHSGDKKELVAKTLIKAFSLSYCKDYEGIKVYVFEKGPKTNRPGLNRADNLS